MCTKDVLMIYVLITKTMLNLISKESVGNTYVQNFMLKASWYSRYDVTV